MFSDVAMKIIESHEDRIAMIQRRLYRDQMELIEAYKSEWAELNHLIKTGQWDEKAMFKGNCYGIKVDEEIYILQLDTALPFLPNTFYRSFKETSQEFYAIKLIISLQLRDVIEQIGDGPMKSPAALMIKHYYHNVRAFDLDNKAKQVVINTLRRSLIIDDNINRLSFYSEEAIWNDLWENRGNRTMLYLCPCIQRKFFESEVVPKYPRIDNLAGVFEGKIPQNITSQCSPERGNKSRKGTKKQQERQNNDGSNMENFM